MRILYADEKTSLSNSVVALGNFDGVHVAHQVLIKEMVSVARKNSLTSVVYTFSEHPRKILGDNVNVITLNSERERIFADLGVDVLVYQQPSEEFLKNTPQEFVDKTIRLLGVKQIIVGQHYSFGCKASGDANLLEKLLKKHGVDTLIMPLLYDDGQLVSSSKIRELIACGEILRANKLLGREFAIFGAVEHGNHIGRKIGFPTANLVLQTGKITPKFGVYACKAVIDNVEYDAIANIGIKPTFDNNTPLAEVHIFDVNCDFYNKQIMLKLFNFIREEIKFNSVDELINQIAFDVKVVKEYFSQNVK